MYLPGTLESVFIEIICPNTSNLIVGCIYNNLMLHTGDFNSDFNNLLYYTNFQKNPLNKYFYVMTLILTFLNMRHLN